MKEDYDEDTYEEEYESPQHIQIDEDIYLQSDLYYTNYLKLNQSRIPGKLFSTGKEIKAVDVPIAQNFKGTGQVKLMNGIQTGSGYFNRTGSKIEMKSIQIKAYIYILATATQDFGRVLLIYDRQANGAAPSFSDIIQGRQQDGTTVTNTSFDMINLDNRDRFVVLRDKCFFLSSQTDTAGVITNVYPQPTDKEMIIDWYVKLKGLTTHFKSSSSPTTPADINTGALYLVNASGGSDLYSLVGQARLRYNDN